MVVSHTHNIALGKEAIGATQNSTPMFFAGWFPLLVLSG